jgi:hypothetical protein
VGRRVLLSSHSHDAPLDNDVQAAKLSLLSKAFAGHRLILEDMSLSSHLRFGPLGPNAIHLCVDMQTLFAERTDWHVPWLQRVLPMVTRLSEARCERTVFTRFVPPERPEDAVGAWRRYYAHWRDMTGERLDPRLIRLVPPLALSLPRRLSSTSAIIRRSASRLSWRRSGGLRLML